MQSPKKTLKHQSSQAPRPNSFAGKKRSGQNGNSEASVNDTTFPGLRLHLLAKELKTIRLLETMCISGKANDQDIFKIIDTEEKQLQAIEDLYKILKAQPRYKNLKDPNWKITDSPIQVLLWILKRLGPLAKGNNWTTDIYKSGNKLRFRFVVFKFFHRNKVDVLDQFIPFDFLPVLRKRDLPLHNLIIELIALVSRVNKIPLWDEDGDFSTPLKFLISNRPTANETLDNQRQIYKTGVAAKYLKIIKQRRKEATLHSVYELSNLCSFKSQRKREINWWLEKGIDLVRDGGNIHNNTFIPNYNTGTPTTPFRQFKFVWSLHPHDYLRVKAYDQLRKDDDFGSYIPLMFTVTKPNEVVQQPGWSWYPEALYDFMKYGHSLFCMRYRQYFYKNQFEELLTPAENFLQSIEISEIQSGFVQPTIQITI